MIKLSYGSLVEHNAPILAGFDLFTKGDCEISPEPDLNLPPFLVLADPGGK